MFGIAGDPGIDLGPGLFQPGAQLLGRRKLMQTGEYRTIATMWGVEKGRIDKPAINGAMR